MERWRLEDNGAGYDQKGQGMKIAIEGCCHGELDRIYAALRNQDVRLLIICGDFQSIRNVADLDTISMPDKYKSMGSFYKYYSGAVEAPILTIFIGGNHEASAFLQELPYGGWVAKNIYYMGYANVISFAGLRIGGQSGIYYERDFKLGHHERPPYDYSACKSAYHVRNIETFRLKQITRPLDIFLSHDWPTGICHYGDVGSLLRRKPFFKNDINSGRLGSPAARDLLMTLKPKHWFSAHLHCRFTAEVVHDQTVESDPRTPPKVTRFLALDKCLPNRQFLEIIDMEVPEPDKAYISLDPEWLAILQKTNHLMSLRKINTYILENERYTVSDDDIRNIMDDFIDLRYKLKFKQTALPLEGTSHDKKIPQRINNGEPKPYVNPQTRTLCTMLDLVNPFAVFTGQESSSLISLESVAKKPKLGEEIAEAVNDDEIDLGDDSSSDDDEDDKTDKDNTTRNANGNNTTNSSISGHKSKLLLPEIKANSSVAFSPKSLSLPPPADSLSNPVTSSPPHPISQPSGDAGTPSPTAVVEDKTSIKDVSDTTTTTTTSPTSITNVTTNTLQPKTPPPPPPPISVPDPSHAMPVSTDKADINKPVIESLSSSVKASSAISPSVTTTTTTASTDTAVPRKFVLKRRNQAAYTNTSDADE